MNESKIMVAVRKRPLSKKENNKGQTDIITIKNTETVIISEYKQKVDLTKYIEETVFNFDFAFDEVTTNQQIYDLSVKPLIDFAFQGAKISCFAYGQTGSGKTFTMNGDQKMNITGIYTMAAQDIFDYLADPKFSHLVPMLSFYQIYCGKLYDLLNKRQQLKIREDNKSNINIIGMEEIQIYSWNEFTDYLRIGSAERITSENSANSQSSRSHAILQVTLKDGKKTYGKLSFIDLAGNERGADHTDQKKQTKIDGAQISKSLLALKECIRALDQGKGHTPFRGSKLTMVLKDSFVGLCKTLMIGNISPSSASSENTLNTLRYAQRVKQLKRSSQGLSKEQIKAREMMLPRQNRNAIKIQISNDDDAEDIEIKRIQAQMSYGIRDEQPQRVNKLENKSFKQSPSPVRVQGKKNVQKDFNTQRTVKQPTVASNLTKLNMINDRKVSMGDSTMLNESLNKSSNVISNRRQSIQNISKGPIRIGAQQPNLNKISKQKKIQQEAHTARNQKKMNNYVTGNEKRMQKSLVGQPKDDKLGNKNSAKNHFDELLKNLQQSTKGKQSRQLAKNASKQIHQLLFSQQKNLLVSHSNTLRSQLDIVRNQMTLIQQIQQEKTSMDTHQYLNAIEEGIQQKISMLEMLRQKTMDFRYKLERVQQLENNKQDDDQDELLLDDLH